jgi:drug/metabolite transporter (DMT)-like permease
VPAARVTDRASAARAFTPPDAGMLIVLAVMWGLSFLFIEFALRGLTPIWIVAARTLVGGVILLAILRLRGRRLPRSRTLWRHLIVLGVATNALPWAAVAWSQRSLPSGLVALLMAMTPTSTLIVSVAVKLERLTPARLAGLLLAVTGVGVTFAADLGDPGRLVAMVVVVTATILYAGGAVYASRYVSGDTEPMVIATGQVLAAFAVTVPVALVVEGVPTRAALDPSVIGGLIALGTLGTGFAFLLFYALIARVGATNATMVTYLIPVIAVLAGAIVLDERLGRAALAGGGLIVLGIWLAQRSTAPARPVPPAARPDTPLRSAPSPTQAP